MDAIDLERELTAYYEQEAALGRRTEHGVHRLRMLAEFVTRLRDERRETVVDVGAGPGLDVQALADAGLDVVGLELAPGNVRVMRERGLRGVAGSLYELPFRPGSFDAAWTMSTLVHVPDDRFDDALAGIVDLVEPTGLIGIGTWGGFDFEGVSEFGDLRPFRFFSLRDHVRFVRMLGPHGELEHFETLVPNPDSRWEYQFAMLRRPS